MSKEKTLLWNMEDYVDLEDYLDRALGEANHWANYRKSIEQVLPEGDEDLEEDRAEGLELIRNVVNVRKNLYAWKEEMETVIENKSLTDFDDEKKIKELDRRLKKAAEQIVVYGWEVVRLRSKFQFFIMAQDIPERIRGRQPRNGALTQED